MSAFSCDFDLDIVAAAQPHPLLSDRLRTAEQALDGTNPQGLSVEQLDWISTELGRALQSDFLENSAQEVLLQYPLLTQAAAANAATQVEEDFVATLASQLGVDESFHTDLQELVDKQGYPTDPAPREAVETDPDAPSLLLDPVSGKLLLSLPYGETTWLVDAGFDTFRVTTSTHTDAPHQRPTRISIVRPTAKITATNTETGKKYRLPVIDRDFPVMFFGPDLRPLANPQRLTQDSVFVLAPTRTKFCNGAPADEAHVQAADELRFTSWDEWSLFEFRDLAASDMTSLTLQLSNPDKLTTRQVRVSTEEDRHARLPEWLDAEGQIPDVAGADGEPIFEVSPQLRLPVDGSAEWLVELYYVSPDGERELVEQLLELEEFVGSPLALFNDVYEDAWVGHYHIDVLRNDVLMERRSFNLAEGFHLRVTYNGANFRHPDQKADENAYTKAYYTLRREPEKFIEVPFERTQSVARTADSESFRITNAVDYSLDVVVLPKALRYSLDLRGEQPDWDTQPAAIAQDMLSKNGELKVHFPVPIAGTAALLLTHEVSHKVKVLPLKRRRYGEVFTLPNSVIRKAFPDAHANLVLSAAWHPANEEDTFAEYGADYASRLEFEKAYEAHASGDIQLATLLRLNEAVSEATGNIVGDRLRLSGIKGAKELSGFLWPLTWPDTAAWPVLFDASGSAELPAELAGAGPLLVDVLETQPGYHAKAPGRPTAHAFVVTQDGHFEAPDSDLGWKLSAANKRSTIGKEAQPTLWRHLYALRHLDLSALRELSPAIRKTIDADPRHMLEALGRSNVRAGDQPALAVAHGLVNYDFHANGPREVDFRAVPWIRVVEQLNDLVDKRLQTDAELADATDFIGRAGAADLIEILQDRDQPATPATQQIMKDVVTAAKDNALNRAIETLHDIDASRGVADEAALRHGWAEILRRRKKFEDIAGFAAFRDEMFKQEANVIGDRLRMHLQLLRRFGMTYGQRQKNRWAWVPYLTAMAAHISRAAAAELKGAKSYYIPLQSQHLDTWAAVAQLAPSLTTYEIVREEARQLIRANGAVDACVFDN